MPNTDIVSRFNEIYNSTSKTVLTFITARCAHTADISDIVQDTYMELYQAMCKLGAHFIKNDKAFVLRIAKQKLSRHYSWHERQRTISQMSALNEDGEEVELSDLEADEFLTENFVVNKILIESAEKFIKQKPEEVKKVFYFYYGVGMTIPEIARTLSIKESNVKNKLYRTLRELRNLLS